MIIQNAPAPNPAVQAEVRAPVAAPVRTAPEVAESQTRPAPAQPAAAEVKAAVATINKVMQQSNLNLEFSVDTDTDRTVVRMVDTATGELIRQFPSEATLAISRDIDQLQQGLLLTQKA